MKKKLFNFLKVIVGLYIVLCGALYFIQEKFIFFPQVLESNYQFDFEQDFEEFNLETTDGHLLSGLLFKADSTKGLIFYLHGNAGSLSSWGNIAKTYTDLNYDLFLIDYRGFGESEGSINSEEQMFEDNQIAYDALKRSYDEAAITILGYSIGTGLASKLASENKPKRLILQAPYYSLTDMMRERFPFAPAFLLKYKFATHEYLKKCNMPISIFHGNRDKVIDFKHSIKLKEKFKNKLELIELHGQGHNGMSNNQDYQISLKKILSE